MFRIQAEFRKNGMAREYWEANVQAEIIRPILFPDRENRRPTLEIP